MRRIKTAVVLCCLTATLVVGCNTARGIGQDTQALGRNIEKTAK